MKIFLKIQNFINVCISSQMYAVVANRRLSMLVSSFEKKYIPVSCVDADSEVGH